MFPERSGQPVDGNALFESTDTPPSLCTGRANAVIFVFIIKGNRESIQCLTARRGRKKERTVKLDLRRRYDRRGSLALRTRARHGRGRRSRHAPTLDIAGTLADIKKIRGRTQSKVEVSKG
jgi:hypothetical protein